MIKSTLMALITALVVSVPCYANSVAQFPIGAVCETLDAFQANIAAHGLLAFAQSPVVVRGTDSKQYQTQMIMYVNPQTHKNVTALIFKQSDLACYVAVGSKLSPVIPGIPS